ncbi:MAG: tetratricopeptide repeat protein [Kofleriaceae bacterium]
MGKRFVAIVGAAAVVGGVAGVWTMRGCHRTTCDGRARRETAWNEASRTHVKSALGNVPWANETLALFDRAGAEWEATYHEVCTDDAKVRCLEHDLEELAAVASVLGGQPQGRGTPDSPTISTSSPIDRIARIRAPLVVAMLPSPHGCETVHDSPPNDRELAQQWARSMLAADTAMAPLGDDSAAHQLEMSLLQIGAGESKLAAERIGKARDQVIGMLGDKHPELARYDEALAAADRARGKLREALKLHDRAQQLREAAYGPDAPVIAISLLERSRTELEGGDIAKAEHSLHRAIAIREKLDDKRGLAELWTAIADCDDARGDADGAKEHRAKAQALDPAFARTPERPAAFHPGIDPAAAIAAKQFQDAIDNAGEEPTRTALAAAIGLADATKNPQAARTAISLFQAMPQLDRTDLPRMQELAKS